MTTHEYRHTIEQILNQSVGALYVYASDVVVGMCVVKLEMKGEIETFILDEKQKQLKPCDFDLDELMQIDADQLMNEFNK